MKRKSRVLLLCGTIMMTMFALTGCGKTKVNLNDSVKVKFTGYNEAGTAEMNNLTFAQEVVYDNWELFGLTKEQKQDGDLYTNPDAYNFMDNVSYTLDKTTGLSNGDKVKVQWTVYDNNLTDTEKKLKAKFEYSDMELTVEGLEDAQSWDPFANVEYSYSGTSKNGFISINGNQDDVPDLLYTTEIENGGLSNGDVVKIVLEAPDNQDVTEYCMTYGKIPTTLSTEVTVDGLEGCVTELTQIPDEILQKMDGEVRDKVAADAAATWAWKLSEMESVGNYLLCSKDGNSYPQNYLYYIYKITELNEDTGETVSYYYYGLYENVIRLGDGTISVDLTDITVPKGKLGFSGAVEGEAFLRGEQYFVGYEDLETLFNKQVVAKSDKYTYTSTVNQ